MALCLWGQTGRERKKKYLSLLNSAVLQARPPGSPGGWRVASLWAGAPGGELGGLRIRQRGHLCATIVTRNLLYCAYMGYYCSYQHTRNLKGYHTNAATDAARHAG